MDESECDVTIVNDVTTGKIGFEVSEMKVQQSDKKVKIPVHRRDNCDSKFDSIYHQIIYWIINLA